MYKYPFTSILKLESPMVIIYSYIIIKGVLGVPASFFVVFLNCVIFLNHEIVLIRCYLNSGEQNPKFKLIDSDSHHEEGDR
jgi:hypothetical protein